MNLWLTRPLKSQMLPIVLTSQFFPAEKNPISLEMLLTKFLLPTPSPSISLSLLQNPTASFSNLNTKKLLLSSLAPLAFALTLNSPLPSLAIPPPISQTAPRLPPPTPYSQSKSFQIGLENGYVKTSPSLFRSS